MNKSNWYRTHCDYFQDPRIILIRKEKNWEKILIFLEQLKCIAAQEVNGGKFLLQNGLAYDEKMLAAITGYNAQTVQRSLKILVFYGLMTYRDGVYAIADWQDYQSLDLTAERKREYDRNYQKKRRDTAKKSYDSSSSVVEENIIDKTKKDYTIQEQENNKEDGACDEDYLVLGEFDNVRLRPEEHENLRRDFPCDYKRLINELSTYLASKGVSYTNHYATLKNWASRERARGVKEEKPRARYGNFDAEEAFALALKRSEEDDL